MKKFITFFKENGSIVWKFILYQIVWSVMGIMVSWPVSIIFSEHENKSLFLALACCFTAGIFCFQVYDMTNQIGLKYSIRKNNPAYTSESIPNNFYGLKIALLAYIPTMLLVLLYVAFYMFGGLDAKNVMIAILYMLPVHSVYSSGFLAIPESAEVFRVLYTVLSLVPAIFFTWLGYFLGLKDKGSVAREKASKE